MRPYFVIWADLLSNIDLLCNVASRNKRQLSMNSEQGRTRDARHRAYAKDDMSATFLGCIRLLEGLLGDATLSMIWACNLFKHTHAREEN